MARQDLEEIGFESVGRWELQKENLRYVLDRLDDAAPVLYAFVTGQKVTYVGKTVRTLEQRLYGYRKGSGTQRTNIRVRGEILRALGEGRQVEILGFHDAKPMLVGRFLLNLPAALEDDIISVLNPPWNGSRGGQKVGSRGSIQPEGSYRNDASRNPRTPPATYAPNLEDMKVPEFNVAIGRTHFRQGFFNVPRIQSHHFPAGGARIEIQLPEHEAPLCVEVNRSANTNGTPRIMGGVPLRQWFQSAVGMNGSIRVRVLGEGHIAIAPT